jgi:hypothetical protein
MGEGERCAGKRGVVLGVPFQYLDGYSTSIDHAILVIFGGWSVLDDSKLLEEITAVASAHVGLDVGGEVYQCLTLMED